MRHINRSKMLMLMEFPSNWPKLKCGTCTAKPFLKPCRFIISESVMRLPLFVIQCPCALLRVKQGDESCNMVPLPAELSQSIIQHSSRGSLPCAVSMAKAVVTFRRATLCVAGGKSCSLGRASRGSKNMSMFAGGKSAGIWNVPLSSDTSIPMKYQRGRD